MPILLKKEIEPEGELGVWKIEEDIDYFETRLTLFPEEKIEIKILKDRKRREWFASRYLLHLMSGRDARAACYKDEYGKPHLRDSEYQISMSHSVDRVAVIASPNLVGVDIQKKVSKITRIGPKFLSAEELKNIPNNHDVEILHAIWGAKECMYKAYGRRGVDFKKHIFTKSFVYNKDVMNFKGEVIFGDYHRSFDIFAFDFEDYILVYAITVD